MSSKNVLKLIKDKQIEFVDLRFTDPNNANNPWEKENEKYWMPVDLYIGGQEHAVLHLLYARFWHHVLDNQQNFFNCFAVVDTFVGTSLSFEFCAPPARVRSRGGPGGRHAPPGRRSYQSDH